MGDPITQTATYLGVKKAKKALTPNIPDMPTMEAPSVQRAAIEEAQRRKRAKGYQSTVLSSFMPSLKQTLGE